MDRRTYFAYTWGLLCISSLCEVGGLALIKSQKGAHEALTSLARLPVSPLFWLGAVLFVASPFLFAISLSRMEMSIAYPAKTILSTGVALLAGVLLLGETLSVFQLAGCILLAISTYFLITD